MGLLRFVCRFVLLSRNHLGRLASTFCIDQKVDKKSRAVNHSLKNWIDGAIHNQTYLRFSQVQTVVLLTALG